MLERIAVGVAEGFREFFRGVREVLAEGLRGEVEASVHIRRTLAIYLTIAIGVDVDVYTHLVNQTNPSLAVCFFPFNSFLTRSCNVSLSIGAANCLSRIFLMLPFMSFFTGWKATLPRTSKRPVRASLASRNSEVEMAEVDSSMGTWLKDRLVESK